MDNEGRVRLEGGLGWKTGIVGYQSGINQETVQLLKRWQGF